MEEQGTYMSRDSRLLGQNVLPVVLGRKLSAIRLLCLFYSLSSPRSCAPKSNAEVSSIAWHALSVLIKLPPKSQLEDTKHMAFFSLFRMTDWYSQ
jgi:hypothetical protein